MMRVPKITIPLPYLEHVSHQSLLVILPILRQCLSIGHFFTAQFQSNLHGVCSQVVEILHSTVNRVPLGSVGNSSVLGKSIFLRSIARWMVVFGHVSMIGRVGLSQPPGNLEIICRKIRSLLEGGIIWRSSISTGTLFGGRIKWIVSHQIAFVQIGRKDPRKRENPVSDSQSLWLALEN